MQPAERKLPTTIQILFMICCLWIDISLCSMVAYKLLSAVRL